ncbi:MAG: SRPBCC domain-containing protein [Burkholderiaceae bacterium]|nr:SRPBCC domain-containing protein [Burkholderiaceae bacterium]
MSEATKELTIRRRFAAPVEKLYGAWCDPAKLRQWHAPGTMTVPEVESDFRVGGTYRIVMQNAAGEKHIVNGEYLEIAKNTLLRMTWQWEGSTVRTEIALRFTAHGKESELQLTHSLFPDTDARNRHNEGWTGCLENLAKYLTMEGVAA